MTTYLLSFRPYAEIFTLDGTPPTSLATPTMIFPSRTLIPTGNPATEADLVGLASNLSVEVYQMARSWHRSVHRSTVLMMLTTGGVIVYLLYKQNGNSSGDGGDTPRGRQRSRWRSRGWLWWLFGLSEELVDDVNEESLLVQGQYFGHPSASSLGSFRSRRPCIRMTECEENSSKNHKSTASINEGKNTTYDPSFLAPCPNCVKGTCRLRKHKEILQDQSTSTTTSSSYTNSPLHATQVTPGGMLLPPTSTPESADDENSDFDDCPKSRAERFHSRFFRKTSEEPLGARLRGDGQDLGESPALPQPQKPMPKRRGSSGSVKSHHVSFPTAKIYSTHSRVPPVGQDRLYSMLNGNNNLSCNDPTCSDPFCMDSVSRIDRDESVDSIMSVSGSMMDLVKGAREVRRLIREASFDSLSTDFSLDIKWNEEVGASTEFNLNSLQTELSDLKDNCSAITDKFDRIPPVESAMSTSKSDYSVALNVDTSDLSRDKHEGSIPDLRSLHKPKRHFWKMTTTYQASDFDSPLHSGSYRTGDESLEWDSPLHGWHDTKKSKYKVALSSQSASECGEDVEVRSFVTNDGVDPWEWDCEGLKAEDMEDTPVASMLHHRKWLPEQAEKFELDLEAELQWSRGSASASTSRSGSRRPSFDRNFYYMNKVRQPPSGRSSVDRGSGDTPREQIDHDALVRSFGVACPDKMGKSVSSVVSDESGFQDGRSVAGSSNVMDASGTSSVFQSSVVTLSPVHEMREPSGSATATPVSKAGGAGKKNLFPDEQDLRLCVVVDKQ